MLSVLGVIVIIAATCALKATGAKDYQDIAEFKRQQFSNVAFYHIFAAGDHYQRVMQSQLFRMNETGLRDALDAVFYSPVGERRAELRIEDSKFHKIGREGGIGYEEDTLDSLYEFCRSHPASNVLYFHDKGSFHFNAVNEAFREMLDCFVLTPHCIPALKDHDICGWRISPTPVVHFSGNYWWATCRHISSLVHPSSWRNNATFAEVSKKLSPCMNHEERYFAEQWIGTAPAFKAADCMPAAVDTSYIWGYKMPGAARSLCPNAQSHEFGHKCETASTIKDAELFRDAYHTMYNLDRKECRDNDKDVVLRSQLWYGQDPVTWLEWIKRLRLRHDLKEGDAVRPSDSRQVYYYTKGELRAIPSINVFAGLGLDFDNVVVIYSYELSYYKMGASL